MGNSGEHYSYAIIEESESLNLAVCRAMVRAFEETGVISLS